MFFLLRLYPQRRQPLTQESGPFLEEIAIRPTHQQMVVAAPLLKPLDAILLILGPMPRQILPALILFPERLRNVRRYFYGYVTIRPRLRVRREHIRPHVPNEEMV